MYFGCLAYTDVVWVGLDGRPMGSFRLPDGDEGVGVLPKISCPNSAFVICLCLLRKMISMIPQGFLTNIATG